MASFNDIATSLRVDTQLPLDHKQFAVSQLVLADLGDDNNLAFTYYDNLKVFCWNEKTEWVWREVQVGEENTGLVASDFVYPNGVVYPNPGYEGKAYNFFPLVAGTDTKIIAGTNIIVTGNGNVANPYVITNNYVYTPTVADAAPLKREDEGGGLGVFLRARDPLNFGSIGLDAFDISTSLAASAVAGATGRLAFAQGENVISSQFNSVSFGKDINNGSSYSLAMGRNIDIFGIYINALGIRNSSAGKGNTILGVANTGNGAGVTILGQAANVIATIQSDYNANLTKPVLAVGNGIVDNVTNLATSRSDAFLVRHNGILEAPSLTIAGITAGIGRTLVTKEYLTSVVPAKPYKAYVALLSQSGASAPALLGGNPLENELGGAIVWVRTFAGVYKGTLLGSFPTNKTFIMINNHFDNRTKIACKVSNVNEINIYSYDDGTPTDNMLNGTSIEIRVYN